MFEPHRPTIGVSLSGGAAYGIAHVGVLTYFAEHRIPVDRLAGVSAGAVVAALYAYGTPLTTLREEALALSWNRISAVQPSRLGLISNRALGDLVTRLVGERNLEDAPIPLAIGTTDIRTGRTVVLQHGPVADAVRASAAIPGLFRPIELDGRLLVDGGLTDNLISASLVATGADVIVGVDVIAHAAKYADPKRYTDVLSNTFNIFVHRMNTASRDHFDVLIDPDVGRFQITDLSKGADLIEAGYRAAKAAHARIDAAIAAKTRRPWWRPRWHRAAP